MKNVAIFGIFIALILCFAAGCSYQQAPAQEADDKTVETNEETETEDTSEEEEADEAVEEEDISEFEVEVKEVEKIVVEPVRDKAEYREAKAEPSDVEKDTCGCAFTWDPVCGRDGKTYINKCLYQCFGNDLNEIASNSQCSKKNNPEGMYTDDLERDYETDKWNGGYCWRPMWKDSGIRYCENLIVNGRVNDEPAPLRGNWLDEDHLIFDKDARKETSTIKLKTGQQASNEEYDLLFQPLFETGKYRLSFWARQDVAANNDWKVRLTLKDWWDTKPKPVGIEGCYMVYSDIDANRVYTEEQPKKWKHYHYEFEVPLDIEKWTGYERESESCEYDWDLIPNGYGLEITGPTVGDASFDDFVLEKIE